jgi:phospholipid/cholesterol/gamma-HCH transport system substrate-binding protein
MKQLRPFLRDTVAPIRDQIRPFTRQVRGPLKHLRQASRGLGDSAPPLRVAFRRLNELLNALAFNPSGSGESFLFWLGWLNHNANSAFSIQDANGPVQRGLILIDCNTRRLADAAAQNNDFILTLLELTRLPTAEEIC